MSKNLFEIFFGSDEKDGELHLVKADKSLAKFLYDTACDEICARKEVVDNNFSVKSLENKVESTLEIFKYCGDASSDLSLAKNVKATLEKFKRVIELLDETRKAKENFLVNFEECSPIFKKNIEHLKEHAVAIQNQNSNGGISKMVAAVLAGIATSLLFLTALAPESGIASSIGGGIASCGVFVGTAVQQNLLLKQKLNEAKDLLQDLVKFSDMAHWLSYPEKMENAMKTLISYDLFKEIAQDMKKFFDRLKYRTNLKIGEFKDQLKEMMKLSMKKITEREKWEFGDEMTPIVITFIFVICLMNGQNRTVLECLMRTQRLVLSQMSKLSVFLKALQTFGEMAAEGGMAAKESLPSLGVMDIVTVNNVIDVLNVEVSKRISYKSLGTELTTKIELAAEELENGFLFIEKVYKEVKKHESIAKTYLPQLTTIIVNSVPIDGLEEDIKMAIKPYLPEEAWGCIELQKLSTTGNNWLVKVPPIHSELLLRQSEIVIKDEDCIVTQ